MQQHFITRLLAATMSIGVIVCALAPVAMAEDSSVVYAVGGARAPGIPWYDYTNRAGASYYPNTRRDIIEYPAGAPFSWVPTMFDPDTPRDNVSIGVAIQAATNNLDDAIRNGTQPAAVVGLSQGTLALNNEMTRLAGDSSAPQPENLQFTLLGDPTGTHGFGQSFLASIFGPKSYIPFIDYTMPPKVDSQYTTTRVVAAYDGIADFPDRPDNLISVANAVFGAAVAHTPAAFTSPSDVPWRNRKTSVNSRGGSTTTYLVPVNHLPMTLPLRYLGFSDHFVDDLDTTLQPIVDAGYSRNDNGLTRPVMVDPANGMDPIGILDPPTRDSILNAFAIIRDFLPPLP